MTNAPEISVIMANYNGARYLGEAIRSLAEQTLKSWELIFVDDASQDASVAIATRWAEWDVRIRILRLAVNRGPGAARNLAITAARGRWIAILDSDDLMRPARLARLLARAQEDGAPLVADNMTVFSDEARAGRAFLPRHMSKSPRSIGLAEFVDSNRLYSHVPDLGYLKPFLETELLRQSGIRYDERLHIGEDYDFLARLLACGVQLRLEPAPLYLYRRHTGSTSRRITSGEIRALIAAHERFLCEAGPFGTDVRAALRRRERSLHSMLLYDHVVTKIKTGQYLPAAGTAFGTPRIWPLLIRPLCVRLRRLTNMARSGLTAAAG